MPTTICEICKKISFPSKLKRHLQEKSLVNLMKWV